MRVYLATSMRPGQVMAVALAALPEEIYFCDGADEVQKVGCDIRNPEGTLLLVWTKPTDTGAAEFADIPIMHYELELAHDPRFASPVRSNFTEDLCGDLYATQNVCIVVIPDLSKGSLHYARVRARTLVGTGLWSTRPTVQVVISKPSPPQLTFLGSGGDSVAFLRVFVNPPKDFGDGIFAHGTRNTTARLISYNFSVSSTRNFEAPSYSTSLRINRVADQRSSFDTIIVADSSMPLAYGSQYYVRVQVENAAGLSNWSNVDSRVIAKRPGALQNVRFRAAGPLAFNISWTVAADTGAGPGIVYPLDSYQIVVQMLAGIPNLADQEGAVSFDASGNATSFRVENLNKGSQYWVSIRGRNDAKETPLEQDWGYGPWSEALAECVDGNVRPSVCGEMRGLTALALPSSPSAFKLQSGGSGVILPIWDLPIDTGNGTNMYPLVRYDVQFATRENFTDAEIFPVPGRQRHYLARHLAVGDERFVRVRAVNDAGASSWSAALHAAVLLLPDAPQNVPLCNYNLSILITWAEPLQTGLGHGLRRSLLAYDIKVEPLECPYDSLNRNILLRNDALRNFSVHKLVKGCVYSVRLRAQNEAGWSDYSPAMNRTALGIATRPINLTALPGTALQAVLTWEVPLDTGDGITQNTELVQFYQIQVFNLSDLARPIRQMTSTGTLAILENLPRIPLECKVFAVTPAGVGDSAKAWLEPLIPMLSNTTVTLSSLLTGASVSARIRFAVSTTLDANNKISVRFPVGFDVAQVELVPTEGSQSGILGPSHLNLVPAEALCGTSCTPSAAMVTLRYSAVQSLSSGSLVDFSLRNIVNRPWAGFVQPFEVRTMNSAATFTIDEDLNVSASPLRAGELLSPRLSLVDARSGQITRAEIEFTTSDRNPWPFDGQVSIEFPGKIRLRTPVSEVIITESTSSSLGTIHVARQTEQSVTFQRFASSPVAVNTRIRISISFVHNDNYSGFSTGFSIALLTSSGHVIDKNIRAPGINIVPGNLTNTSVTPFHSHIICFN